MGLVALPGGSDPGPVLTGAHAGPDFEQEIVDQYALAMAAAGLSDGHIRRTRAIVIEFARTLTGPLWAATCVDADAFLAEQRWLGHSVSTRAGKAGTLAGFYDFVIARYEGTIRRATGVLVGATDRRVQPPVRSLAGQGPSPTRRRGGRRPLHGLA